MLLPSLHTQQKRTAVKLESKLTKPGPLNCFGHAPLFTLKVLCFLLSQEQRALRNSSIGLEKNLLRLKIGDSWLFVYHRYSLGVKRCNLSPFGSFHLQTRILLAQMEIYNGQPRLNVRILVLLNFWCTKQEWEARSNMGYAAV